jgi:hypothetical protein
MNEVYSITKSDTHSNSYKTNRDETWIFRICRKFESIEEAEKYVIQMSLKDIVRYKCPTNDAFNRSFCFTDDKYISERTYFIGKPDKKKIKQSLQNDGVIVLNTK